MNRRGLYIVAIACVFLIFPTTSAAQSASELQKQIDDNNAQIQQLDTEIAQYQTQLDATTKQKNTLQNTINQLTLQSKQLTTKITATKKQISTTQLQIQQLSQGIATKQGTIEDEQTGLGESLRLLDQMEGTSLSVAILSAQTIADAWRDADAIASLQGAIRGDISRLAAEKQDLTDTKTQAEAKRSQLVKQQATLTTQQGSLNATKKAQSELLAQTKSQESAYQATLAAKQAEKQSFERELLELSSQLQYTLDPRSITPAGKGILHWPLDTVYITQYFGNTPFASSGAYNGSGHNGIDLRTITPANPSGIGTPVKAALTGVVLDVNLGAILNCQYGKWVLIRHNNGLTTLYAHLSAVGVTKGQSVATGQIVGYSGNTGYATAPHLHFTVYATDAVSLKQYTCKNGKVVTIPVTPLNGYLNPLNYL